MKDEGVIQLVDAIVLPRRASIADGLLAATLDLNSKSSAHLQQPESCFGLRGPTLRLRHGSHEKALFLVALTDDMFGHGRLSDSDLSSEGLLRSWLRSRERNCAKMGKPGRSREASLR